ncbi:MULTISPECIES: hypothetical protein [unclassified Streptomyces]|uniref:hypothetical protein n=1 Tax=unclassified Streptomyces TaxID=2593676 RepID=UPI0036EFDCE0
MSHDDAIRKAMENLGRGLRRAILRELVIEPERTLPPSPDHPPYELSDRTELVHKEVVLELHRWARRGPTRGVFLGQGERGMSIRVEGGGRFVYTHNEVRSVRRA